ncbi:toxin-antitoxin system HicB family antitoxin [Clostridiaceae bacterium]|nr:toxin-antitoxin system HicB family antitoxin [Clostridiaceae bacterium]NBH32714.1 toxin-antitoxin system HicB family antitoxin [Clostridiaceae bacterium]
MATIRKVFTLRLTDDVFNKIGILATSEHRSLNNYIEYVLIQHLEEVEKERGIIITDQTKN